MRRSALQKEANQMQGGVLLLFGGALGDFLCLLPGLFALRRREQGRNTIVAQPAFLELLDRTGLGTVSIERREVADLFSTGPIRESTIALFGGFAAVHSWIGYGDDNFASRLQEVSGATVRIHRLRGMEPGEHASDYLARCLGVEPVSVALVPPPDAMQWAAQSWQRHGLGDSTLLIHPGSGSPRKNWQGMANVAARWRTERQGSVLLLCGPAEESVDVPHDALIREASLNRVGALLAKAAVYLGNDSGISHLAGLSGARGAVTFGASDPATWHPLGTGLRVCAASSATCGECEAASFCTHRLSVDDVWAALLRQAPMDDRGPNASQSTGKQR